MMLSRCTKLSNAGRSTHALRRCDCNSPFPFNSNTGIDARLSRKGRRYDFRVFANYHKNANNWNGNILNLSLLSRNKSTTSKWRSISSLVESDENANCIKSSISSLSTFSYETHADTAVVKMWLHNTARPLTSTTVSSSGSRSAYSTRRRLGINSPRFKGDTFHACFSTASSTTTSSDLIMAASIGNPTFYRTMHNIILRASTSSYNNSSYNIGDNNKPSSIVNDGNELYRNPVLRRRSRQQSHFHYPWDRGLQIQTFSSVSSSPSPPEKDQGGKSNDDKHTSPLFSKESFKSKPTTPKPASSPISSSKATKVSSSVSSSSSFSTIKAKSISASEKDISTKAKEMLSSAISGLVSILVKTPGVMWFYLTNPAEFRKKMSALGEAAKKEAHHYWMGSKLLAADLRTARQILLRMLSGSTLTRRERKQLLRTVTDVFRLVPMSVFVLIPFMEFALPFALKLFPNMLPSTFQDSLKAEENMKRELKSRIAMAEFFQETLQNLAQEQKKAATNRKLAIKENDSGSNESTESLTSREETAASFLEFIDKARKGEPFPPEVIIRYSTYFQDELTLDNMPRMQLINMCKYMSIPPYGSDNLLRFQLRHKIRSLVEDDQRILWEGIDSLTKMELREACQERGMRSTGLSKGSYKRALQQWIDLSVNRNVPISLLIMSRTFFLHEEMTSRVTPDADGTKSVTGLADAISGLDKEVVNEVILNVATSQEKTTNPDVMKIKLEVLEQQNELIEEEKKEREAAAAKKADKEKAEKEKAEKEKAAKAQIAASAALVTEVGEAEAKAAIVNDVPVTEEIHTTDDIIEKVKTTDMTNEDVVKMEKVELKRQQVDTSVSKEVDNDDTKSTTPDVEYISKSSNEIAGDLQKVGTTLRMEENLNKESDENDKILEIKDDDDEEEEEKSLSTEEMDAISQLVSPDPVSAERQTLERIKAAMQSDDEDLAATVEIKVEGKDEVFESAIKTSDTAGLELEGVPYNNELKIEESPGIDTDIGSSVEAPFSSKEADQLASETIETMDKAAAKEAESNTSFSLTGEVDETSPDVLIGEETPETKDEEEENEAYKDEKLDKAVSRLKSKVESMLGKIEIQLSDVEAKIGDKLHFLDKDMDGILSREEMVVCLQSVLKRPLTFDEAMAIAADMDEDEDGFFTFEELSKWLETNKLVKLVEEGRDAEVDRLIASQAEKLSEKEEGDKKVAEK